PGGRDHRRSGRRPGPGGARADSAARLARAGLHGAHSRCGAVPRPGKGDVVMTALTGHNRGDYRVTMGRVVRSEWTKLRSMRSTWVMLAAAALLTVGLAAAFGYGYGQQIHSGEVHPSTAEAASAAFLGLDLFALVAGVFGVMRMTGEYGSGLIRASLVAGPPPPPGLVAQAPAPA